MNRFKNCTVNIYLDGYNIDEELETARDTIGAIDDLVARHEKDQPELEPGGKIGADLATSDDELRASGVIFTERGLEQTKADIAILTQVADRLAAATGSFDALADAALVDLELLEQQITDMGLSAEEETYEAAPAKMAPDDRPPLEPASDFAGMRPPEHRMGTCRDTMPGAIEIKDFGLEWPKPGQRPDFETALRLIRKETERFEVLGSERMAVILKIAKLYSDALEELSEVGVYGETDQ